MRRFGRAPDRELSDYQRGYRIGIVHGVMTLIGIAVGLRIGLWASRNPVVEIIASWATEPAISPLGLASILFILLAMGVISAMMTRFGGLSS